MLKYSKLINLKYLAMLRTLFLINNDLNDGV